MRDPCGTNVPPAVVAAGQRRVPLLLSSATLLLILAAAAFAAPPDSQPASRPALDAWPMLGGCPARNAVSPATGIPAEWDVAAKKNIKWVAPLGTQTYGGPVVAGGKIFVGTNNGGGFRPEITGDKGCVLCFDEKTGKLLWQATHDKLGNSVNDWPEQGVASTPYVDGDRVYYVSNRCELVCADVNGFADGKNDGPFKDEKYTGPQDADFIWILDLVRELGVFPRNLAASSPVGAGDLVFVCTSNGVDDEHEKPPAPQAPSFIAVDKKTGKVVWKRNDPGDKILRGQWSSPAYGLIQGIPQVIFAGGDGWCYAFEPLTGEPIWKFDLNPKDAVWDFSGGGTRTSIVAAPVICDDKVFLAAGDDPESARGPGHLYAIDATLKGDVTERGKLWHVGGKDFGRTIASVAVADGLVYAVDLDGFLSCFDEKTGQRHWRYDMQAAVWGSPCVADGKVFLGNVDGELVVLRHTPLPPREGAGGGSAAGGGSNPAVSAPHPALSPEGRGGAAEELARNDMRNAIYTTPAIANGALYVATQRFLYAVQSAPSQR